MEKFYVIDHDNGAMRCGEFKNYTECLNYVEGVNGEHDFTIMNTRVKKNILMPIMRMVNDGKQNKTVRDLHRANDNKNGV